MKPNTSICLMLVALSVFLVQDGSITKRRIAQVLAAIVAIVGLLTLSQHLAGWNAGIDQLLFQETREQAGQSFPGRMGIAASLNFSFLGLALWFLDARSNRWFRLSNILVLTVVAITLLVFLYYFYGIEVEPVALYFTIALHTVVAFLSICAAILLARPERGLVAMLLGNSPGAIVARRMWPAFLLVIVLGWIRTLGHSAGWFSSGFATAVFVLSILLLLAGLIWWTGVSLNRTDKERRLANETLEVIFRVSELIRTKYDPYELSYAVACTVGTHFKARRCLFNETDVERDLEMVHCDYCDGVPSVPVNTGFPITAA